VDSISIVKIRQIVSRIIESLLSRQAAQIKYIFDSPGVVFTRNNMLIFSVESKEVLRLDPFSLEVGDKSVVDNGERGGGDAGGSGDVHHLHPWHPPQYQQHLLLCPLQPSASLPQVEIQRRS
jgi:hypothetical protein